jgi:hypothetical protein
MSYANDGAVHYEIHGDYDVPLDHCGGVAHRGVFVHYMFRDDDVKYGGNVVDDVEPDYVVHGDTVVLGNVVQAEYVVQPACVVHGDNMICDDAIQSDYVVHGDKVVHDGAFQYDNMVHVDVVHDDGFAVQIGTVIHGGDVLDDQAVVQVGSEIHVDNVVQYDDVQGCYVGKTDEAVTAYSYAENDVGEFVMKHYYVLIYWNGVTVYGMFQLKA